MTESLHDYVIQGVEVVTEKSRKSNKKYDCQNFIRIS